MTKSIVGRDGAKPLVEDVDYTVAYARNTAAGTAAITITGREYYAGTLEYTFQIVPATLTKAMFTVDAAQATYTGDPITKDITGKNGDMDLAPGTDYTVTYAGNTDVGTAAITVTGQGNYTGALEYTFRIVPATLTEDMLTVSTSDEAYTGAAIYKEIVSPALVPDTDYTVNYASNIEGGTAAITITGKGNYTGTLTYTFRIIKTIGRDMFTVDTADATYTGQPITKLVTGQDGTKVLTAGTDYTVEHGGNTAAGTATVTITGMGNYSGSLEYTFRIAAAPLTKAMFGVDETDEIYTGSPIIKTVTSQTLALGADYTVEYTNNTAAGSAAITITGVGDYTGLSLIHI